MLSSLRGEPVANSVRPRLSKLLPQLRGICPVVWRSLHKASLGVFRTKNAPLKQTKTPLHRMFEFQL